MSFVFYKMGDLSSSYSKQIQLVYIYILFPEAIWRREFYIRQNMIFLLYEKRKRMFLVKCWYFIFISMNLSYRYCEKLNSVAIISKRNCAGTNIVMHYFIKETTRKRHNLLHKEIWRCADPVKTSNVKLTVNLPMRENKLVVIVVDFSSKGQPSVLWVWSILDSKRQISNSFCN